MKKKVIKFYPSSTFAEDLLFSPISAQALIPQWFKDIRKTFSGSKLPKVKKYETDLTIKNCLPFLDSLTSGYLLRTPADLRCSYDELGNREISWITPDINPVQTHSPDQIGEYPIPHGYEIPIFKFMGYWGIECPPGYSLLFMHPLGRFDLPFYSFHGIVDADKHSPPMNIPFLLKTGFDGIIKQGTPYAQVIPIKRESWQSQKNKFDNNNDYAKKRVSKILLSIDRWYRDNIWERKEYL